MATKTYRTRQGDQLDLIVWRAYGGTMTMLTAVLEANPGLAGRGPVLPAGLVITLPAAVTPTRVAPVQKLWD